MNSVPGQHHRPEGTAALVELCREEENKKEEFVPAVRRCVVEAGADIGVPHPRSPAGASVLVYYIVRGYIEAVSALLETPNPVRYEEVLVRLCLAQCESGDDGDHDGAVSQMLACVVTRAARGGQGLARINWLSVLGTAAMYGRLSQFFNVLTATDERGETSNDSTSGDNAAAASASASAVLRCTQTGSPLPFPITIREKMWPFDYRRLTQEARSKIHFAFSDDDNNNNNNTDNERFFYTDGSSTAALQRLLDGWRVTGEMDAARVRRHVVTQEANILFRGEFDDACILQCMLSEGPVNALEACLESPLPIDFTLLGGVAGAQRVMLDAILDREDEEEVMRVLRLVVDRLERHPMDVVDWGWVNEHHLMDFVSRAALRGFLGAVWGILQDVPYFADNTEGIFLRGGVVAADWERLGEAEQRFFAIPT